MEYPAESFEENVKYWLRYEQAAKTDEKLKQVFELLGGPFICELIRRHEYLKESYENYCA